MTGLVLFLPLAGLAVACAFVVALVSVNARRKERQAFYLSEMIKSIGDASKGSAMEFLREYERARSRSVREGMTVAGLVGALLAAGLIIFLWGTEVSYRVGLIPLLPSLGVLVYAHYLAPRE